MVVDGTSFHIAAGRCGGAEVSGTNLVAAVVIAAMSSVRRHAKKANVFASKKLKEPATKPPTAEFNDCKLKSITSSGVWMSWKKRSTLLKARVGQRARSRNRPSLNPLATLEVNPEPTSVGRNYA
jgi:hypothetical protein